MGSGPWAADRRRLALVGVLVGVVVVGSVSLWTISHAPDDGDSLTRAASVPSEPAQSPDVRLPPTNGLEESIEPEPV
ncbi:hypothetical protein Q3H92_12135, partial [Curtobacterium flaccumfaciens]|nr:hypothetical protein [Curtobacterium flaccumfaciens]